ncbi:dipeptidase [Labilibaculum antarcticum]|uniref:Dipeptidase n=1 Tax=Labilibaculum antarcticum TaxID=1717717 RepID=A0A1Y1CFZ4_9BACT|nr:C69 family dipeptidase [Labilibaculum antarcticum]BAX79306.1 peptidase [Labilibaculum antarcticum]
MKKLLLIPLLVCTAIWQHASACTDIVAGKKATVDGSVITSHTYGGNDTRIRVVHGQKFPLGSMTPVYYGLQEINGSLNNYGEVIGEIPQVEQTYTYFHSAYSHTNEFQLAIAESTLSQKDELQVDRETGKQIMTVEQAQIFALQRCRTARGAIQLITSLMDQYGFLPSCGPESEALCIADPNEVWVLEIVAVGKNWTPESGKSGAIWAAQRVPDDHIAIVPNWSIIKEIDLSKPEWFMASENYQQVAIDHGWYNPDSGKPFIWQEAYSPCFREWASGRFWLFYSQFAPNLKQWPDRKLSDPFKGQDAYHQYVEDVSIYPFSVKPEKKISVQDIMAFQRSTFEGTIYDKTSDPDWYVPNKEGKLVKSPLTTPFPTTAMRELLDITNRRNVSKGNYGMICQLRSWLPDAIGGVYWVFQDNQFTSPYVPIYAGTQEIHESYKNYDPEHYNPASARWAIDFVDNLMYLRWQDAVKDMQEYRDPFQQTLFDNMEATDKKAKELYDISPKKAKEFLTQKSNENMQSVVDLFTKIRDLLITKYTNNKQGS